MTVTANSHPYRTHTCEELRLEDAGIRARISGWVHRKRDHGNLLFLDLRDHYGITQVVVEAGSAEFAIAEKIRLESVITVTGDVEKRGEENINPELPTGNIELRIRELKVESESEVLPIQVVGDSEAPEELRLRYRFIDLRRDIVHSNIILRNNVIASIRDRRISRISNTNFNSGFSRGSERLSSA